MSESNILYPIPTTVPRQYTPPIAVNNSGGRGILSYLAQQKALAAAIAEANKNRAHEKEMSSIDQANKIALMAQSQLLTEMTKRGYVRPEHAQAMSNMLHEEDKLRNELKLASLRGKNAQAQSDIGTAQELTGVPAQQMVKQGEALTGIQVPGLDRSILALGSSPFTRETESAWDFANQRQIPGSKEAGVVPPHVPMTQGSLNAIRAGITQSPSTSFAPQKSPQFSLMDYLNRPSSYQQVGGNGLMPSMNNAINPAPQNELQLVQPQDSVISNPSQAAADFLNWLMKAKAPSNNVSPFGLH